MKTKYSISLQVLTVLLGMLVCFCVRPAMCGTQLTEGDSAPDFTLISQDGTAVTLSSEYKKNFVVLYFYPMDDTPGCTKQACFFRDINSEYLQAGAKVLGVSVDTVASHKKFAQKYNLNFTLLADPDKEVTGRYGVKSILIFGKAKRVTFIIDKKGIIRKIYRDVDVNIHSQEVLRLIKKLRAESN